MKKLLLFVFAAVAFAACEQAPIEEQSVIRPEAPDTITVGFEGDDTRIQLNASQKTVWNSGDEVSVFYRSNGNQKWQYKGEDGVRQATLSRVQNATGITAITKTIVVYPYDETYWLNTDSYCIEATTPATQHYAVDSYGVGDNLMVSQGEFTQFSLKNVYGWLKLQLTGDGETIKSIKFRGNNGEQVAGLIYVDTATAEATLAAEMGSADDNNAGGNLVFEDTILTEVTLDCGDGVALGKNATAFYIALPPQTFENGFKVEIVCADDTKMVKSSNKALSIERNHIQPMAEFSYTANISPSNQIWYTSSDGNVVEPNNTNVFGVNITSNKYNNGMGIITFDGDVTKIGNNAFNNCDSLTSVNIPDSVTTIGEWAFHGCTSLTNVDIPDSVTTIGIYAFGGCTRLTEFKGKFASKDGRCLIIDGRLNSFAPYGLSEYTIPDSITEIGDAAFRYCDRLTSVTIPDSVTTIGDYAFHACHSLTNVNIPDSVTTIGNYAFWYCTSLTEFTGKFAEDNGRILVIDGVLNAFAPAGITEYNIPDSVTEIGNGAFRQCTRLTSVNILDSVTKIGQYAFSSCTSLTSVNIPDSVTTIGEWAFYWCTSLTSVTIGDSVTTIGDYAFYRCTSLTSVNIPDSVTTIGGQAFNYCSSMKKVYCYATIPPALGYDAFYNNASVRQIYVYEECVEPYKLAWSSYKDSIYTNGQNCPDTTTIEYTTNDGNIVTTKNMLVVSNIYENGVGTLVVVGKIAQIPNSAFASCNSLTSVNIPDSVTTIGNSAFSHCTSLTSVNIPDSVTTIGTYAFSNCDSLTSVNIPDSVTTIGKSAFEDCDSLKEFTGKFAEDNGRILVVEGVLTAFAPAGITEYSIPDGVTTIGNEAFRDCESLTSVNIPDSVTTIGDDAFLYCTSLKEFKGKYATEDGRSLIVDNTIIAYANASGNTYNIPDSVTTIGGYAFYDCDSLTSVNIGDSVTTIGVYAFCVCNSLTSVTIGDSVTTIGQSAFNGCDSLTSVTIGDSVTTIGDGAFNICISLKSVYCKATTPPASGYYVFDYNGSGRKIYVPAESVDAYKSATNWSEYKSAIVGYDFKNGVVVE